MRAEGSSLAIVFQRLIEVFFFINWVAGHAPSGSIIARQIGAMVGVERIDHPGLQQHVQTLIQESGPLSRIIGRLSPFQIGSPQEKIIKVLVGSKSQSLFVQLNGGVSALFIVVGLALLVVDVSSDDIKVGHEDDPDQAHDQNRVKPPVGDPPGSRGQSRFPH